MPTPSAWAFGVAAPSALDPYQSLEALTAVPGAGGAGALTFGTAGGEASLQARRMGGHWSEIFDFKNSVAPWILLALLAIGVLHIGFGAKASGAVEV